MRVLVTGATGFIGQHVTSLFLKNKVEVAILTRQNSSKFDAKNNLNIINGSLDSLLECKEKIKDFKPNVCLHLAWEGIPDYSFKTSKKNLDQSINLFDFLIDELACKKIVVAGSCFEYGKSLGQISENTAEQNTSAIAWAKNSLKNYLALKALENNTEWLWMRIFYVFGPGQRSNSLIPSLVSAIRQGLPCPIRNPSNANDFVYIDDVANALTRACLNTVESGVYNLGSGALFKVSDIWSLIQKNMSHLSTSNNSKLADNPMGSVEAIGSFANIEKAKNKLNWSPSWTVENGIKHFVNYILSQEAS